MYKMDSIKVHLEKKPAFSRVRAETTTSCGFCYHPIFKNYCYNKDDNNIYYIPLNRIVKQNKTQRGYAVNMVSDGDKQKCVTSHRFVFECCNGDIEKGYEIDHINKNKLDNRIENLRCITINENRKCRDHTNILKFAKIAHTLKRFIKAVNIDTNEVNCFKSKSQCGKFYNISAAMVYLIVEGLNRVKIANTTKGKIKFEYTDENEIINLIEIPHGRIGKKYPKSEEA